MVFYVCTRGARCGRPCNEDCYYTRDFFKSKMYNDAVKPVGSIPFLKSKFGDWYEVKDWNKNLPEIFRSIPQEVHYFSYDELLQVESIRRLSKSKSKNEN